MLTIFLNIILDQLSWSSSVV